MQKLFGRNKTIKLIREINHDYPLYLYIKLLDAFLMIVPSILNVYLINDLTNYLAYRKYDEITKELLIYIAVIIGTGIIESYLVNYAIPIYNEKISKKINKNILTKCAQLKPSILDDTEFMNRYFFVLQNSCGNILSIFDLIASSISIILGIVSVSFLVISYDVYIIGILVIGIVLSTLVGLKSKVIRKESSYNKTLSTRKISYVGRIFYLREYAEEIRYKKPYQMMMNYLDDSVDEKIEVIKEYGKKGFKLGILQGIISSGYLWIIIVLLVYKVVIGKMKWSAFFVTYTAVQTLTSYLIQVISLWTGLFDIKLYLKNYFEYIETQNDCTGKNTLTSDYKIERIKLENVSFGYRHTLIKDFNFEFKKGTITAIVGENGSGKTTLLKLLKGHLTADKGRVLINNNEIENLDFWSLNEKLSCVNQEFRFYPVSIAQNIIQKYWLEENDYNKIKESLEQVGLFDKITCLPNGMNTILTKEFCEEGSLFSGGEMQRLAIARALAQDTNVIILDEPFSAIDFNSNQKFKDMLKNMANDKIIIYVTHNHQEENLANTVIRLYKNKTYSIQNRPIITCKID